jgi:hypothetical protein
MIDSPRIPSPPYYEEFMIVCGSTTSCLDQFGSSATAARLRICLVTAKPYACAVALPSPRRHENVTGLGQGHLPASFAQRKGHRRRWSPLWGRPGPGRQRAECAHEDGSIGRPPPTPGVSGCRCALKGRPQAARMPHRCHPGVVAVCPLASLPASERAGDARVTNESRAGNAGPATLLREACRRAAGEESYG